MLNVIAFTGTKGSGKDTAGGEVISYGIANGFTVDSAAFAAPLKQMVVTLFEDMCPDIINSYRTDEDKKKPLQELPITPEMRKELNPEFAQYIANDEYWSCRTLLQYLGTNVFKYIRPTIWMDKFELTYIKPYVDSTMPRLLVVTDLRFQDELDFLRRWGLHPNVKVTTVRIERRSPSKSDKAHASESAIESLPVDRVIHNKSTMKQFRNNVRSMAHDILG